MADSQVYDIIIAGAGAAGLSLAWHLTHSPQLRNKRMLLVDRSAKTENDRTWGYWAKGEEPFDALASWRFKEAEFISEEYAAVFSLAPYSYQVVEGRRFYQAVRGWLAQFPNVEWVQQKILGFEEEAEGARMFTEGGAYRAKLLFNSCFLAEALKKAAAESLNLKQHFKGWVIETKVPAFNSQRLRLFDLRTPQQGSFRFFYLIPQHERRALVEYTLFSDSLLAPEAYERALEAYIAQVLQLNEYEIVAQEWGVIPMTTYAFPRQQGRHIVNIGSVGGASKPSTGYTFRRIQQQCRELVQQLEAGQQLPLPKVSPGRHRLYDAALLNILDKKGAQGEAVFSRLFKKNPPQRLLKFLDEETSLLEELMLMQTVDKPLFIGSILNLATGLPLR